ncbi:unnamed protein product [Schistosoma rodhaini]|nr:unnamed protein product [Schistosoma rodhaini]
MVEPPLRRKRALSFAGYSELPKLSGNVHFGQLPTAFRIRHPSFVYPDGDPALDQVLGGFSQKLNNKQNGVLTSEGSSDIKDFGINGCDLRSRKSSVATVVDHPLHSCISTPEIYPKVPSSCSDSVTKLAQPLSLSSSNYSDYILPDSPLSSNLVKLYLAKVATSKPTEYKCPNNSSRSRSPQTSVQDDPHRLPECLQIHLPTLASMIIPVKQIIRAHTNQNKSEMKKSDKLGNSMNVYLNGRNAVTDASYSSEYSDGEPWGLPPLCDHTNTGYLSDNHLIEAVSEAKMLNMSKQQLEMRLNIRPGSKSISSSRTQTNSRENLNRNYLTPKFEFTHVYDGLKTSPNAFPSSNKSFPKFLHNSHSNLNLTDDDVNGVKSSVCYSVPGSPNINSKYSHLIRQSNSNEFNDDLHHINNPTAINNNNDNNNINNNNRNNRTRRFERLRDFLGTFKNDNFSNTDEDDHYFYMDPKSVERRMKCQASNIILPVSF